jgi:hypothetical protein
LREPAEVAARALKHAQSWLDAAMQRSPEAVEAGARRFALTIGGALQLALLVEHGSWALAHGDGRYAAAARIFSRSAIDRIDFGPAADDARALLT